MIVQIQWLQRFWCVVEKLHSKSFPEIILNFIERKEIVTKTPNAYRFISIDC